MLEEQGAFLPARWQTSSPASLQRLPRTCSLLLRGTGRWWWLSSPLLAVIQRWWLLASALSLGFVRSCFEAFRGALLHGGEMLRILLDESVA